MKNREPYVVYDLGLRTHANNIVITALQHALVIDNEYKCFSNTHYHYLETLLIGTQGRNQVSYTCPHNISVVLSRVVVEHGL